MLTYNEFEKLLAYHCAPCLMGLKPANLISCGLDAGLLEQQIQEFHESLSSYPIRIKLLYHPKSRKMLFIYNIKLLEQDIFNENTREFLKDYGYPCDGNLDEMLEFLSSRIKESKEYPHEIGVFLGYPLDDVIGFIHNHGKNYKACGYWKVYSNENSTKQLFDEFTKSRLYLFDKIASGFTLKDLHNLYSFQTNELHKSM